MKKIGKMVAAGILAAVAVIGLASVSHREIGAADHLDPPRKTDPAVDPTPDRAADIADIYAWHAGEDFHLILTFAGPHRPELPPTYDRDALYEINISNDGDPATTEIPIRIRFGFDGERPGVQVTGLPGGVSISGPVQQLLTSGNVRVEAGIFDDPFFFDAQGLRESRTLGTLRFNNQRDFFSNANVTLVAIQLPRALIQNGTRLIHVWSAASRFGGDL